MQASSSSNPPKNFLVPFTDYSQWERRPRRPATPPATHPRPLGITHRPGPRHAVGPSHRHVHITPSPAACLHGHGRKTYTGAHSHQQQSPKAPPKRLHKRIPEPPTVKVLKIQIAGSRTSVGEYEKLREELSDKNLGIMSCIIKDEENTHTAVRELLERYQKFKGALATLKARSTREIEVAKSELEATREKLHNEIEGLRRKVSQAQSSLQSKSQEFHILLHYKEKEYPVKLVRIEQLKEDVEVLMEMQKVEMFELEAQMEEERESYEQKMEEIKRRLEAQATEVSIGSMQRSVKEKAIQNSILEKEILIHRQKAHELQESVRVLKSRIRYLKHRVKNDAVRRLPLVHLGKCLPDTDVQLNIPIQQDMPI